MKKIIFCLQTMILGGVEKELIAVLKKIHVDFDITLLLLYPGDLEIIKDIPNDVHVKIMNIDKSYYCSSLVELAKQRVKRGKLFEAINIVAKRCLKIGMPASNININDLPILDDTFDIAVCYHIHSPLMLKYTAQKIKAEKKIAWIHNDFYTTKYPIQRLKKFVVEYDEFVAVSKKVENEFRALCLWYQGRISTAYNYLDSKEIIELSNEHLQDEMFTKGTNIKILTIGRFVEQKGIDIAIETCAMLKEKKLKFRWFVIGYGELENTYRKLIKENEIEDCFIILGRKMNPYPYIKNCDIYVQPSRHEAYPLVLMEAKIFRKPIVCTDFDGADEQIDNGTNGIIVPIEDTKKLCEEISNLIISSKDRVALSKKLEEWHAEDDRAEIVKHFK